MFCEVPGCKAMADVVVRPEGRPEMRLVICNEHYDRRREL